VDTQDIDDLAEYVMQLTGQQADATKAAKGKDLFLDNAKGNCFDCHTEEGHRQSRTWLGQSDAQGDLPLRVGTKLRSSNRSPKDGAA
jgi:mono/diheme cytochrome c family protein